MECESRPFFPNPTRSNVPPRTSRPILAGESERAIAFLAGRPNNDPSWETDTADVLPQLLDDARASYTVPSQENRRGRFTSVASGYTFNGGMTVRVSSSISHIHLLTMYAETDGSQYGSL